MAKLTHGLNGPFTGAVGTVVGSSWKGIPYIKARYKKRTKKITRTEAANRVRFAQAQQWLKPLLDYVRQGFKGYTSTVEGFVAAKSYLMRHAMKGAEIDPSLMLVSYGDLPLADDVQVTKISGGRLKFTWDKKIPAQSKESGGSPNASAIDNGGGNNALNRNDSTQSVYRMIMTDGADRNDQAMLLAYNAERQIAFYTTTGQFRHVGEDTLAVDAGAGRSYHVYFAFNAADRSRQSMSLYLGTVAF